MAFTKSIIFWSTEKSKKETEPEKNLLQQAQDYVNEAQEWIGDKLDKGVSAIKGTIFGEEEAAKNEPEELDTTIWKSMSLDVVLSESHNFSNEVTGYPISNGFIVSEHTIRKNPQFNLNGWVTDVAMPVDIVSVGTVGKVAGSMLARGGSPVLGSLLGSAGNVVDNLMYKDSSPTKDAFELIKELVMQGTIVHVSTILGTYENSVIRSASITQNVSNSSVLPVSLSFEKLYMVEGGIAGYISPELSKALEAVKNDTTGSWLDNMFGMLTKQGVNILQVATGVDANG